MTNNSDFITIDDAAKLFNKSKSNISYLIQYGRVKTVVKKNNRTLISKKELEEYFANKSSELTVIKDRMHDINEEIAFFELPEKERTKHVHRLHPYLGKYIPQLVEFYLKKAFKSNQTILDPFMGSGTTIIESNVKGVNSIGIDVSEFNCIMVKVKVKHYDLKKVEFELTDILKRVRDRFNSKKSERLLTYFDNDDISNKIGDDHPLLDSSYLVKWFSSRTLQEMSTYKNMIREYHYQDLLKLVLSRSARSARQTFHFELTRPTHPVTEPYFCHKHKGKICAPVQTCLPHLKKYTKDTIRRLVEFSKIQTRNATTIINDDSRSVDLEKACRFQPEIDGMITSPPYVGVLDYHEQHRYAYEMFDLEWNEKNEIGPAKQGSSKQARREYKQDIIQVLSNVRSYLKPKARLFIVANDKHDLYPEIIKGAGYTLYHVDHRPVTSKASRERTFYSESIFEIRPS
ncbi:MAG: DNA methyltransferase [Candidatus Hodarchaeales archaeon]|jgi:DNA modification methylase